MHKLGMIVTMCLLAAFMGCIGSKSTQTDAGRRTGGRTTTGGSVSSGGSIATSGGSVSTGGATAPKGGTGGGSTGVCIYPSCMSTVAKDCTGSGACTIQSNPLTGDNICYENGVKLLSTRTLDMAVPSFKMTTTVMKGSTVCYSMDMDVLTSLTGTASYVVNNSSGSPIATMTVDSTTKVVTVTCTGGQPEVLDSACSPSVDTCASGTCTP